MVALPANSTETLFLDYTTGVRNHTMQFRYPIAQFSDAQDTILNWLTSMDNLLPNTWRILGGRVRALGSSITLPQTLSAGLTAFAGVNGGSGAQYEEAREHVWVGRGLTSGRRVEVSLYGLILNTAPDFRHEINGGLPSLQAGLGFLNAFNSGLITIGGDRARWFPYVNVNFNSYWETRSRRG